MRPDYTTDHYPTDRKDPLEPHVNPNGRAYNGNNWAVALGVLCSIGLLVIITAWVL